MQRLLGVALLLTVSLLWVQSARAQVYYEFDDDDGFAPVRVRSANVGRSSGFVLRDDSIYLPVTTRSVETPSTRVVLTLADPTSRSETVQQDAIAAQQQNSAAFIAGLTFAEKILGVIFGQQSPNVPGTPPAVPSDTCSAERLAALELAIKSAVPNYQVPQCVNSGSSGGGNQTNNGLAPGTPSSFQLPGGLVGLGRAAAVRNAMASSTATCDTSDLEKDLRDVKATLQEVERLVKGEAVDPAPRKGGLLQEVRELRLQQSETDKKFDAIMHRLDALQPISPPNGASTGASPPPQPSSGM